MSSKAMLFDTVAETLEARLTEAFPEWSIRNMSAGLGTRTGVTLYYEQGDFTNTNQGNTLPAGHIGCEFTLTVAAGRKDPTGGLQDATLAAMSLCPFLDSETAIYWTTGQRVVLTSGEPGYVFPVTVLSRYTI